MRFVGSASSSHPNRSSMCSRCFLRIDIYIYATNTSCALNGDFGRDDKAKPKKLTPPKFADLKVVVDVFDTTVDSEQHQT